MTPEAATPRSNVSLGCGMSTAVADLHDVETVLYLKSGAGADVPVSAHWVAPGGRTAGLDTTDEMSELAHSNAEPPPRILANDNPDRPGTRSSGSTGSF
jgi:arsenite methyltransferase